MDAGGVGMLKQWHIVLYLVLATLVVATEYDALADESFDGWRPKSRSVPEEVLPEPEAEMLQLVPGEINQVVADDETKEEPFDWMDERYGQPGVTSQGNSNTVGAKEVVMMASQAPPPSGSQALQKGSCNSWCTCQQRRACKQCGLHLPSVAMYPADEKESAGGYLNLADANPQKVFEDIRVGLSQVNDQIQSTLGRF
ncbi:MAG: hypothetical protein MUP93_07780 [Pirellulales bacterium]|nr:hypothetical protein [Pirellulales bacterium]